MNLRIVSFLCIAAFFVLSSYSYKTPKVFDSAGIFSCTINDKPYIIHGINAEMRTVTGGFKQLSLSNDLFTSFFFINPTTKEINLTTSPKRDAVVRYTNPINLNLYLPEKGTVTIEVLDEKAKIMSGAFEMELIPKTQSGKKIKITNGKLINIPIVYK